MTAYSREQTAAWDLTDWNQLAGKAVALHTENIWVDRTVMRVRFGDSPYGADQMVTVEWVGGGSLTFGREPGTEVIEHEGAR